MTEAEKRMREIYAQELDRDGEGMAAFLWRDSGPAHPDSSNGRIIRAMLAAEAAAIERAAKVADDTYGSSGWNRDFQYASGQIATAIRSLKGGASHVG